MTHSNLRQPESLLKQFIRANNLIIDWIYHIILTILAVVVAIAVPYAFWGIPYVGLLLTLGIFFCLEKFCEVIGDFESDVLCSEADACGFLAFILMALSASTITLVLSLRCLWMLGAYLLGLF